jgi:hypothetical protein
MLGVIRRGPAAVRALRACSPQLIHFRATPLQVKWKQPLPPVGLRALHFSPTSKHAAAYSAASAEPIEESPGTQHDRITQFQELADRQLVDGQIIHTITKRMNIATMTDVQSLTIHETLKGNDVYVFHLLLELAPWHLGISEI